MAFVACTPQEYAAPWMAMPPWCRAQFMAQPQMLVPSAMPGAMPPMCPPGIPTANTSRTASDAAGTMKEVEPLPAVVAGNVWRLSQDQEGCRLVQEALEDAPSDDERAALAAELKGHVWEALKCMHANHVLQKCVMTIRPQFSQFIIDELMQRGSVVKAARHKYGCRILQRLLEHCRPMQVEGMVGLLLQDAVPLSRHIYGTYVMQRILEHGTRAQRHELATQLRESASALGADVRGCAVLSMALSHADREDRLSLAKALVRERGLITSMARTRHGHLAAKLVLQVVDGEDLTEAIQQISEDAESLRASRYGRVVVASLSGGTSMQQDNRAAV